jgi:hypothetical protein
MIRSVVPIERRVRAALGAGLLVFGACLPLTTGVVVAQDEPIAWTTISEVPKFDPGNTLYSVTSLPSGEAVIVGARGCCGKAWSWHSADGQAWEWVEMPGVKDGQATDSENFGDGLIAVGGRQEPSAGTNDGLVWTTDDPAQWSDPTVIPNADLRSVGVGEDGLTIAGAAVSKNGRRWTPAVWRSADGQTWDRTLIGEPGEYVTQMEVVQTPSGAWVAMGRTILKGGEESRTEMWRSEDGSTWESIPFPGGVDDPSGFELAATPDAVFALVNHWSADGTAGGSAFRTVDGVDWTEVVSSDHWLTTMAAGPTGTLLFTTLPSHFGADAPAEAEPLMKSSTDGGVTWVDSEAGAPVPDLANSATIDADGRVIVAGMLPGEDPLSWLPTIWLGS